MTRTHLIFRQLFHPHFYIETSFTVYFFHPCNTNLNRHPTAVMDCVWRAEQEPAELSLALKVGQPNFSTISVRQVLVFRVTSLFHLGRAMISIGWCIATIQ